MGSYQAIYDAVRSSFDFSYESEIIKNEFINVTYEMQRPSVLFKPKLSLDGNMWCALYGDDLQCGVAGFGKSPDEAMRNFDIEWNKNFEG